MRPNRLGNFAKSPFLLSSAFRPTLGVYIGKHKEADLCKKSASERFAVGGSLLARANLFEFGPKLILASHHASDILQKPQNLWQPLSPPTFTSSARIVLG
jgi:hypothetical protein